MGRAAMVAATLLALLLSQQATQAAAQDFVTVSTTFNLIGPQVAPWDNNKESDVQGAIAQSAGHGVSPGQVKVSVVSTDIGQPGVRIKTEVPTDPQLASSVQTSIDNALKNNQIVNIFNNAGSQAQSTELVSASDSGGGSGTGSSGNSSSGNNGGNNSNNNNGSTSSSTNSSSSGGGGKKSFPGWAVAIVVILVLVLIGIVGGYFVWRKVAERRAVKANQFEAASYFSNTRSPTLNGGASGIKSTTANWASGLGGMLGRAKLESSNSQLYKGPSGTTTGAPRATTPKGSSLPMTNPTYIAPQPATYTPTRAGRLMSSLRGINDV